MQTKSYTAGVKINLTLTVNVPNCVLIFSNIQKWCFKTVSLKTFNFDVNKSFCHRHLKRVVTFTGINSFKL